MAIGPQVFIFGDYQWSPATRLLVSELLPFANIVPTDDVLRHLSDLGHSRLAKLALDCWSAMKLAVSLLHPPDEYCFMDDDVFVLDAVDDALNAFRGNNLVFSPDADYSAAYAAAWGRDGGNCIGQLNTGLYWLRNQQEPRDIASNLLRVPPNRVPVWQWEQGFLATRYAREMHHQLPSQRYFYPYFDGLPGGILGYDYAANPCGFATIHFGGLAEKPDDMMALALAPSLLGRRTVQLVAERKLLHKYYGSFACGTGRDCKSADGRPLRALDWTLERCIERRHGVPIRLAGRGGRCLEMESRGRDGAKRRIRVGWRWHGRTPARQCSASCEISSSK